MSKQRTKLLLKYRRKEETGFFLFKKNVVILISYLGAAKQFDGMSHEAECLSTLVALK